MAVFISHNNQYLDYLNKTIYYQRIRVVSKQPDIFRLKYVNRIQTNYLETMKFQYHLIDSQLSVRRISLMQIHRTYIYAYIRIYFIHPTNLVTPVNIALYVPTLMITTTAVLLDSCCMYVYCIEK